MGDQADAIDVSGRNGAGGLQAGGEDVDGVNGLVVGVIFGKSGTRDDHGDSGAAFIDGSFKIFERSIDGSDAIGAAIVIDENHEGVVSEGDRSVAGRVIEFVENVANFLVHGEDHGGIIFSVVGKAGETWVIDIGRGADGAVRSGEGDVEEEGIGIVVVPVNKIHGSDSKGVGHVVVGGIPGSGCFENGIGKWRSDRLPEFARSSRRTDGVIAGAFPDSKELVDALIFRTVAQAIIVCAGADVPFANDSGGVALGPHAVEDSRGIR